MTNRATPAIPAASLSLSLDRAASDREPPTSDAASILVPIMASLSRLEKRFEAYERTIAVMLERLGDFYGFTFDEVARLEQISKTAARRRYGRYAVTIPGTRRVVVPAEHLKDGFVLLSIVRKADAAEKTASKKVRAA